jgi:cytochrome b
MVVALLVCLLGTCWSGLKAYGEQGHGPLATYKSRAAPTAMANDHEREHRRKRGRKEGRTEGEEFWKEIHEGLSNFTVFLVLLHVVGGLTSSALHRENLIKAMITGYKTRPVP